MTALIGGSVVAMSLTVAETTLVDERMRELIVVGVYCDWSSCMIVLAVWVSMGVCGGPGRVLRSSHPRAVARPPRVYAGE